MAMRELKHLQEAAEKLTASEQIQLAEYLLEKAGHKEYKAKTVDLSKFVGTVKLKEDPMEYQKRIRAEWP